MPHPLHAAVVVWFLPLGFSLLSACSGSGPAVSSDSGPAGDGGLDAAADVACAPPEVPAEGARFSLTAAGAPVAVFGPVEAPTFREGFAALREAGFTRFFPFFSTREIVDRPEGDTTPGLSSGHEAFFFTGSCDGGSAFAAASDAGMEILFPAFFFFPEGEFAPFDEAAFSSSYARYRSDCFRDHEDVITGFYSYDEMSSNWAGIELTNRAFGAASPLPRIESASALATAMRSVSSAPIYAVDGPAIPLLERDRAAIEGAGVDLDALLTDYETQLRAFAASADVFGFDAYPIPESYWFPIQTSGDLVRLAQEVAPSAKTAAVLQGMSFDAQGGHTGIGAVGPPPSLRETRFMAFDAIAQGADELLWYGPNFLDLDRAADRTFWIDLQTVVGELASLGAALTAPRRRIDVGTEDVAAVAFEILNGELLVVVNRSSGDADVTLPLAAGTRLIRHGSGEVQDDLQVALGPLEVQVYLTTSCP